MSFARLTNTAVPGSPFRVRTAPRTSRSSIPPPLTIRSTTASPCFHAATTFLGRPGPGISASGLTDPVVGGGGATTEPLELPPLVEPTTGAVVPAAEELETPELEEALLEDELFFFRLVIMNSPTTITR